MNILFVTSTRIGDAVLTTGVFAQLVRRYPGARITVVCGAAAMPLFAAAPNVVRRIEIVKRKWARHWFDIWRACIKPWWGWDLIVDLRGSLLAHFLIARRRHVYRGETGGRHRLYGLAKAVRLSEPPAPCIWTTPANETEAARLVPDDGPVLALGPTAKRRGKIWPAADFVVLAQRLTGSDGILPDARIAVFGAPGERDIAQPVFDGLPADRLIDLVGKTDLPTAAAALGHCALFVGNESGLMHLAAAVGIPTLGLFGPSRPEIYAPWGACTAFVRTAVSCTGLFPPGCEHRSAGTLMGGLGVEAVEAAAIELWRRCDD